MSQRKPGYRDLPFPDAQRQGVDWHSIMTSRNTIHGLVELDITETRKAIHRYRRAAGEPLSFTALIVASFAHVVGADPSVQALRRGRNRVVVFDDVDVTVLVEQVLDGERIPIPHIVRAANRKTPSEVDREIRAAKASTDPYARARKVRAHLAARARSNPAFRDLHDSGKPAPSEALYGHGDRHGRGDVRQRPRLGNPVHRPFDRPDHGRSGQEAWIRTRWRRRVPGVRLPDRERGPRRGQRRPGRPLHLAISRKRGVRFAPPGRRPNHSVTAIAAPRAGRSFAAMPTSDLGSLTWRLRAP